MIDFLNRHKGFIRDLLKAGVNNPIESFKLATSDPVEQLSKGLLGKVLNKDFVQTEENFDADVVSEIKNAALNAIKRDSSIKGNIVGTGTTYSDYGKLFDGTSVNDFVKSDKARGNADNFLKLMEDPKARAAMAVGQGSIQIIDGDVYFTDKYNFGGNSNKGKDVYSKGREIIGDILPSEGEQAGNTIKIYLGSKDEIIGREIKKGDTLSKIAKQMNVSVKELVEFNNIKDVNKIKIGQNIKKPVAAEKQIEEVQLAENSEDEYLQKILDDSFEKTKSLEDMQYKTYTIKEGDTLSKIAKANNTTISEILENNNITNPNKIRAGASLIV